MSTVIPINNLLLEPIIFFIILIICLFRLIKHTATKNVQHSWKLIMKKENTVYDTEGFEFDLAG